VQQKEKGNEKHLFLGRLKPEPFTMDSPGVNCVDRHKEKDPSRVAFIWGEKNEPGQEERVTYGLDINITTNS
jgi:hypothetical protein